ncbi:formylglycine-generating enzyme family protein [Spirochaeta dissipatitropha]
MGKVRTGTVVVCILGFIAGGCAGDTAINQEALVQVPGGTFSQVSMVSGARRGSEFEHTVSSFEIGMYPVTYALWYEVRNWAEDNGYEIANPGLEGSVTGGGSRQNYSNTGNEPGEAAFHPLTAVSWRDAVVWLNAYSEKQGLRPVYYQDPGFQHVVRSSSTDFALLSDPGDQDNPQVDWNAGGYRLPTEGEWQYAAAYIDGSEWTDFNAASGAEDIFQNSEETGTVAWYRENSDTGKGIGTQRVGLKRPNALGIYDMSGNVWEWVWDLAEPFPTEPQFDYRGADEGSFRVLRGGSFEGILIHLLVSSRDGKFPFYLSNDIGFRVARTLQNQEP